MIRRPPRSTLDRSSAASDVYKRQTLTWEEAIHKMTWLSAQHMGIADRGKISQRFIADLVIIDPETIRAVSYTHLRAHETVLDLVCRLLLEKKKTHHTNLSLIPISHLLIRRTVRKES